MGPWVKSPSAVTDMPVIVTNRDSERRGRKDWSRIRFRTERR